MRAALNPVDHLASLLAPAVRLGGRAMPQWYKEVAAKGIDGPKRVAEAEALLAKQGVK